MVEHVLEDLRVGHVVPIVAEAVAKEAAVAVVVESTLPTFSIFTIYFPELFS